MSEKLGCVGSGHRTAIQNTNSLGSFIGSGTSFATWQNAYLVDANTNKVILNLGGVDTLQFIGDYNENVNYFELVPVTQITIRASTSGTNCLISYPTLVGFNYTVYYKTNLTDPVWTPLGASVPGNGLVKTATDVMSASTRFYQVGVQ